MPAKYVRPYSKGEKNDYRDAEAIAEAARPTMKFVATKSADQLDLQALHRVRERLVGQRTGIINQIRAFLLERGIAVRQGLNFLRAELPAILAKRTDVLSPRMLHVIEDVSRRLAPARWADRSSIRRDHDAGPTRQRLRATDDGARHWPDHLERDGGRDRQRRRLFQGPRLRGLARTGAEAVSTGDRTILGSISKRGNRYLRTLFVQAAWVVLVKVGPEGWERYGLNRGSRRRSSACTAMCWRSRSPTNSPASPGRYSTRDAPSSASRPMRQRPDLLDPRAVLRAVKAWPANTGASGEVIATASLDGPCARRACTPAGRDEGTAARHEQRNSMKQGDYR